MKEHRSPLPLAIGLATLALVVLAFAPGQAGANTTYTTFADGAASKSLTFNSCGDSIAGFYFAFPDGSYVLNASFDLTYTVNASGEDGTFSIDIGNDRTTDVRRDIRVDLFDQPKPISEVSEAPGLKAGMNQFLSHHHMINGTDDIPVVFSACPTTGPLTVLIDQVLIVTTDAAPANSPPVGIAGGIIMDVFEGDTNVSTQDLREIFADPDGDDLYFCLINGSLGAGVDLSVSVWDHSIVAASRGGLGGAGYDMSATDNSSGDCTGQVERRLRIDVVDAANYTLYLPRDIPDIYTHAGMAEGRGFRLADYFNLPALRTFTYALITDSATVSEWNNILVRFESDSYNASAPGLVHVRMWAPNGFTGDLRFHIRVTDNLGNIVMSNEATLHVGTWEAPQLLRPLPSFTVVRGERIVAALRLADYFAPSPWGEYSWNWHPDNYGFPWTSRLDVVHGWLSITANAANWTGALYGTIEACEGSVRCTPSNNFTVRFVDPVPASLAAPMSIAADRASNGAIPANTSFNLSIATAAALPSDVVVTWYLESAEKGQGPVLQNLSLPDGVYRAEARLSTADGERWVQVTLVVGSGGFQGTAGGGSPPPPSNRPSQSLEEALPWLLIPLAVVLVFLGLSEVGRAVVLGPVLAGIFARLNREALLDHFARGRLYQLIVDEPGIHFTELRDRTRISNGAAVHHLRVLEKGGYIRLVVDGSRTRYFPTDKALDRDTFGLSDTDRAVLEAVADRPGISQPDLQSKVGRSASVVSRSVNQLARLGYVTARTEGRIRLVFPRSDAQPAAPEGP